MSWSSDCLRHVYGLTWLPHIRVGSSCLCQVLDFVPGICQGVYYSWTTRWGHHYPLVFYRIGKAHSELLWFFYLVLLNVLMALWWFYPLRSIITNSGPAFSARDFWQGLNSALLWFSTLWCSPRHWWALFIKDHIPEVASQLLSIYFLDPSSWQQPLPGTGSPISSPLGLQNSESSTSLPFWCLLFLYAWIWFAAISPSPVLA